MALGLRCKLNHLREWRTCIPWVYSLHTYLIGLASLETADRHWQLGSLTIIGRNARYKAHACLVVSSIERRPDVCAISCSTLFLDADVVAQLACGALLVCSAIPTDYHFIGRLSGYQCGWGCRCCIVVGNSHDDTSTDINVIRYTIIIDISKVRAEQIEIHRHLNGRTVIAHNDGPAII